jgi:hypothetical protein
MKTFKIYFLSFLFICVNFSLFAQDEIYNEEVKTVKVVLHSNQADDLLIEGNDSTIIDSTSKSVSINDVDNYYTEEDYYTEKYRDRKNKVEVYTEDDEETEEKAERRNANGEVIVAIAEVAIEVLFNVLFFFAIGN